MANKRKNNTDVAIDMSFFQVGRLLALIPKFSDGRKTAAEPLLSLLRTGELSAVALYGSKIVPRLPVPREFWARIKSGNFRNEITVDSSKNRALGMYVVSHKALFDAYVSEVFKRKPSNLQEDIIHVSKRLSSYREVVIERSQWLEFLKRHELQEPTYPAKSVERTTETRGRKASTAWKHILPYVVAEFRKDSWRRADLKVTTNSIYAAAEKALGKVGIEPGTLEDEIKKIVEFIQAETN